MKNTDENSKKSGKKNYSSTVQSMMDIWRVLGKYSSAENPMTIGEIAEKLKEENEKDPAPHTIPSVTTVKRSTPNQVAALNALCPHKILREEGSPSILQTYISENTLHVVIENGDGEIFREDDLTLVVEPRNANPPSYSTIDKLLQQFPETTDDSFPFALKCVKSVTQKGRTKYIPYSDWEDSHNNDHSKNNQPRRYYLESVLSLAEWRILSDLIQVYPYISQNQTKKFLDVLEKLSPQISNRFGTRYAFKRGTPEQFHHITIIDKAIKDKKAVCLRYGKYVLEHKGDTWQPVLKMRKKGPMEVEPYALIWSNGYYYLVGKRKESMINLRVDRIISVAEIDRSFVRALDFDPYIYRDKSPVMYSGIPQRIVMRCDISILNTLLDVFGSQPQFSAPADGWVTVTLSVVPAGVKLFALEYADFVEILEPSSLREEIRNTLQRAYKRYE